MLLLQLLVASMRLLVLNELVTQISLASEPIVEGPLMMSDMGAEMHDPHYVVKCPISEIAVYQPTNKTSNRANAKSRLNNAVTISWYKDDKPYITRENGNKFDPYTDKFKLILYQFGQSDEGTYTCKVNYSNVPPDLWNEFIFHESASFHVHLIQSLPDLPPTITHPPGDFYVNRGDNVTITCIREDTLAIDSGFWFKSCPLLAKNSTCIVQFKKIVELALKSRNLFLLEPFLFTKEDRQTITITNITERNIGLYGCAVENNLGIDIRYGKVDLYENVLQLRTEYVRQYPSQSNDWIWFSVGFIGFLAVAACILACIYVFKISMQRDKKQGAPLLTQATSVDLKNHKDKLTSRQRLPSAEAPDIYNTGKLINDGFIVGHFHQEAGHIMAQSICGRLLNNVNPSISSSNSHHSDEASSSWGKSVSSNGDNCRAFYSHGSNSTATTVPLYDHPPSTGTMRLCKTFVQDTSVINPSYWLLNPENDATEWNFPRRNLERLDKIGEGQFGEVWRYIARSKDGTGNIVAVKRLKDDICAGDCERSELRAEIEIMKAVNRHPNVIKLLHCCIDECGPILLIMEYAENGKLQAYLRSCRAKHNTFSSNDKQSVSKQNITPKELLKFTYHIAKGMEYVASQGIVHRDLASRNILVSNEKVCKVADFGFARRVDDECVYVRKSTNPVPVKWMAPEALEGNKFTSKSDVYSLGILMWEIVTLGATPYEQLTSEGVYKKVLEGGRLERPAHCKDEFFTLMAQCWMHDPELRPTFKEVAQRLETLLLSENNYIELDQYPEHAYYNIVNAAEKEVVRSELQWSTRLAK